MHEHLNSVPQCKNQIDDKCRYGYQRCWFRHENHHNTEENDDKKEVIEKVLNMMETFTERLVNLENNFVRNNEEKK